MNPPIYNQIYIENEIQSSIRQKGGDGGEELGMAV